MTEKQLREIEERANAATEGPWECVPRDVFFYKVDGETRLDDRPILTLEKVASYGHDRFLGADIEGPPEPGRGTLTVPDAWFIAHARTDIPALIAEVRRLKAKAGETE